MNMLLDALQRILSLNKKKKKKNSADLSQLSLFLNPMANYK